jgi:hypothetical protein
MDDATLEANDLEEGMTVRLSWSKRGTGPSDDASGEITRVWRSDGDVREFTVQPDDADLALNVYTEYRKPPVERVEGDDDPDAKTIGRLDEIQLVES